MFDLFNNLYSACIFLLPGFIIMTVINSVNPPRKYQEFVFFLKCLILSVFYSLILFPTISLLTNFGFNGYYFILLLIIISGILSYLIGCVLARLKSQGIFDALILWRSVDKAKISSIPTSWDYVFNQNKFYKLIIHVKNGDRIYGIYKSNSFSSDDLTSLDLYIEEVYDKDWSKLIPNQSVLIRNENISQIDIIELQKTSNEVEISEQQN